MIAMNADQRACLVQALKKVRWPDNPRQAQVNEAYAMGLYHSARYAGQIDQETYWRLQSLLANARMKSFHHLHRSQA